MKRMLRFNDWLINKTVSCIMSFLMTISFSYAGSRVIVEGKSSIIIESQSKETILLADHLETILGGKILNTNYNLIGNENNADDIYRISEGFVIEQAYPNPFNPTTTIKYGIAHNSNVEINIYDLSGDLVKNLNIIDGKSGWHEFTWNGKDNRNQGVSSGVYLVTMKAGEYLQKQKVTFLK